MGQQGRIGPVTGSQEQADAPVVAESSRDGALLVETDFVGDQVRVQLEPEALTWPTGVLADRIAALHRAALMRARADRRLSENCVISTGLGWPSHAEVEEFRRSIDF